MKLHPRQHCVPFVGGELAELPYACGSELVNRRRAKARYEKIKFISVYPSFDGFHNRQRGRIDRHIEVIVLGLAVRGVIRLTTEDYFAELLLKNGFWLGGAS